MKASFSIWQKYLEKEISQNNVSLKVVKNDGTFAHGNIFKHSIPKHFFFKLAY